MKKLPLILALCLGATATTSYARDDLQNYSVSEALAMEQAKAKLGTRVKFYFGDTSHPKVEETFGEYGSNKKTNAFNKSDKEACQWVFLSAMISLKQRVDKEGGNAVINIKSNYKGNLSSSDTEFRCGAGTFMAGVALTGTVVTLAE